MEMLNLTLPATNRFATDYLAGATEIKDFFHYDYKQSTDYHKRLLELGNRNFMRKELVNCIDKYMSRFPSSEKVKESLSKLESHDSVVVIGGQQAGVLTGPLYSIHKIISIIVLARQKEKELNVPVVPIFWIAGEDHDFQEVNHIYLESNGKIEKIVYPEKVLQKNMISNIALNKEVCLEWVEEIITLIGETEFSKELFTFLKDSIDKSNTFVDFFATIIMELFKDYGLLLVDSADPGLRSIEKEILISQIEKTVDITQNVLEAQGKLENIGLKKTIEISDVAANLFYYDEMQKTRVLLEYDDEKQLFIGKNNNIQFSKSELLEIAEEFPSKLSNNVVTRPITQELLFPTLAFIAGPGEIAYWAELQKAFELFQLKMPPIVPRLNITILERNIMTDIEELSISLEEVLTSGTYKIREEYLLNVKDSELDKLFQRTKGQLMENYHLIEQKLDKGLLPLFERNEAILIHHIEFLEQKVDSLLREKQAVIINKYNRVENRLYPLDSPQERRLNAIDFMNQYGIQFLSQLADLDYTFDGKHKVIIL